MIILGGIFDKNNIFKKLEKLNKVSLEESFWKDQNKAKKIIKDKKLYEKIITSFDEVKNEVDNIKDLYNLGKEEKNDEILNDCEKK